MPLEPKPSISAQIEKPNHYSLLKEFRVDQCPLFLKRKCTQHRPYTCFHWHFMNQRRRRPVRKRDGTFNYSADTYCVKFDESTGICPDGDDCPFLHRTAGDTERQFHLRYYKTCTCVHDTDRRGYCVKNGVHCAFAHGNDDVRPAVFDIKELQAQGGADSHSNATANGPNVLDKERNFKNEDPKWQDSSYLLANYKTEQCKRPPRLCRQGFACPQYHDTKDKRRDPTKFQYRASPCSNVKHGDEWGEPANCELGDLCQYCHTRSEQQFHQEIYKSTKCNVVQKTGYCPRGTFCAFAHIDQEKSVTPDTDIATGTNPADMLFNVPPPDAGQKSYSSSLLHQPQPMCSNSLFGQVDMTSTNVGYFGNSNGILDTYLNSDTVESFVGNALGNIMLDDPLNLSSMDRELEANSTTIPNSIAAGLASTGLFGSSDPVNIPGGGLLEPRNFSPMASPLNDIGYLTSNRFQEDEDVNSSFIGQSFQSKMGNFQPTGIYDFGQSVMPHRPISHSPLLSPYISYSQENGTVLTEVQRLQMELQQVRKHASNCETLLIASHATMNLVRRDCEEHARAAKAIKQQRDEALNQSKLLQKEIESLQKNQFLHRAHGLSDLRNMTMATLKTLQIQMQMHLDTLEKLQMANAFRQNVHARYGGIPPYLGEILEETERSLEAPPPGFGYRQC